ncbi:hypothetical protein [Parasaccharibacter apium]|uniref:Uncharacterized protein n=1 Tax=Parasaccharibacter apium TaxID=1510841 RepID=A0ABX4ZP39_9PROT|nr:hypothetical protein [Parasaccharibacter apium]POS61438.1 hypothetical protein ASO19_08610 [Parasaccharibacter apium]POS64840.1 hypothetical protein ASQ42_01755 [Parasaccharibacter apium]POS65335.1 hypothetical protein ASQ43_02965 [Parasaccharibacter apium]
MSRITHITTTPTRERTRKPDYEIIGRRRRRANTLGALSSRLTADVISEAEQWVKDWMLAEHGYLDIMKNGGAPAQAGNVFTFNALQGKAWGRLNAFRRHAGRARHQLLVNMLGLGWSFSSLGSKLYPDLHPDSARKKASEECAATLEMLAAFWQEQRRKKARQAVTIAREHRKGLDMMTLSRRYHLAPEGLEKIIRHGEIILNKPQKITAAELRN